MKTSENRAPELWEQQESETVKAFQAFAEYRDMGVKRSTAKVADKLGKSTALIHRWSSKHKWVMRVEAWEQEKDRIVREELTKGIIAMRKTHADLATAMLSKAANALQKMPVDDMTPKDISSMVEVATKLERLSRGEATERTEGKTEVSGRIVTATDPYEELTTEELRKLARLADERED